MFQLYDTQGPVDAIHEATAVTVGVFDGVHRGHQALIGQLDHRHPAGKLVVTLTSHPSFVLGRRDSEYWLDDPDEHLQLLFNAGAKYVAVLPFTREVAQLPACSMARILYEKLNMRSLLLGYDSRFGSKQNDDFDHLPQLSNELGFTLTRGKPFLVDNEPISSSRIRQTLLQGDVESTALLLGRPYSIEGRVVHGRGVGHTLGFPTANVTLEDTRKMLPKEGVYAVRIGAPSSSQQAYIGAPPSSQQAYIGVPPSSQQAYIGAPPSSQQAYIGAPASRRQPVNFGAPASSRQHIGMANLGAIPTFGIDKPTLEVHLLDFDGDLYGQPVTVEFLHRLRDIVRFDSVDALQHQLQQDLEQIRQWS